MRVGQTGNNQVQGTEVSGARQSGKATAAQQAKKNEKGGSSSAAPGAGSVNADISPKGKEFARAKAVATSAPDVREEKIAELKRRIAEGKYSVDSNAVADRMVDEHLSMSGIG